MSKINPDYENPIDNMIVNYICQPISSFIHKLKITPNQITTIGLLSSLYGSYHLYYYNIKLFIIFYLFAYVCDCLDGFIARKYNQFSKFGDYYDHITDILQMCLVIWILIYKYNLIKYPKIIILSLIILIIFSITQGCQEILMGNNSSVIIGITKKMCSHKIIKKISFLRYFGSATIILYVMGIAYYLWSQK